MEREKSWCIAGVLCKEAHSLPSQSYNLKEQDISFPVPGTAATKILQTLAKKTSMQRMTDNFSILFWVIVFPVSLKVATEAMKNIHFINKRILLKKGIKKIHRGGNVSGNQVLSTWVISVIIGSTEVICIVFFTPFAIIPFIFSILLTKLKIKSINKLHGSKRQEGKASKKLY